MLGLSLVDAMGILSLVLVELIIVHTSVMLECIYTFCKACIISSVTGKTATKLLAFSLPYL